jgi:ribosomal protein S18 acetylase RimI-like enzyme
VNFTIQLVTMADDLSAICAQMQPKLWADDNQMTSYKPELLREFLEAGNILLLAKDEDKIAGAAIAHKLLHPAGVSSLYVHELDTHPDYRRRGVATLLMNRCTELAKEMSLTEVWLGTESHNTAANAFYRTLNPYEVEPSVIYAFRVK